MDLILKRQEDGYRSDGIYSDLTQEATGEQVAVTIEHAYQRAQPSDEAPRYLPITPPGVYTCVRGKHRLDSMPTGEVFETFEITGVAGHSGLLFHWGNFNRDSKGCVCVGEKEVVTANDYDHIDGPDHMVTNSRATFKHFMDLQNGVNSFTLTVGG